MLTDSDQNTSQVTSSPDDGLNDLPMVRRAITAMGGRKMVYLYLGIWLPCLLLRAKGLLGDDAFSSITITTIVALVGGNVGSKFANALNPFEGTRRPHRSFTPAPPSAPQEEDPEEADEFNMLPP